MLEHICVIGCGGVGAAHLLSAAKFLTNIGGGIISIVDINNAVLDRYKDSIWRNSWGPIQDAFEIDRDIIDVRLYCGAFPRDADLYIIATPNDSHKVYLELLKGKKVLCEKPLIAHDQALDPNLLWDDLHYGIEWVYHPIFKSLTNLWRIDFVHGFPPPLATKDNHWQDYDLGSHCLGMFQAFYGQALLPSPQVTKVKRYDQITEVQFEGLKAMFGYDTLLPIDRVILNDCIILDWVPFEEKDLFYRQIEYIMAGNKPKFNNLQLLAQNTALRDLYNA